MEYGLSYYENMLREYSATAEEICRKRWTFLNEHCEPVALNKENAKVLDFGSGVGWFRAFRPRWCDVWSYDIADYPQTGIELQTYDVVTMWDVLEHIPDFTELEAVFRLADYVALSLPIKPEGVEYSSWKHLKPREHLRYYTKESLRGLFAEYGFEPIYKSTEIECPPREDILTALFRRRRDNE
jgi:hypothetical protein